MDNMGSGNRLSEIGVTTCSVKLLMIGKQGSVAWGMPMRRAIEQ